MRDTKIYLAGTADRGKIYSEVALLFSSRHCLFFRFIVPVILQGVTKKVGTKLMFGIFKT